MEGQKQEIDSLLKNAKDLKAELKKTVDKCSKMEEALQEQGEEKKKMEDKLDDLSKELENNASELDLLKKVRLKVLITSSRHCMQIFEMTLSCFNLAGGRASKCRSEDKRRRDP